MTQKITTRFLPHISRIFSAPWLAQLVKVSRWALLAVFLLVNGFAAAKLRPALWQDFIASLTIPQSAQSHLQLAERFWSERRLEEARRELVLAGALAPHEWQRIGKDTAVLGAAATPLTLLAQWESEPRRLNQEYQRWQEIITTRPDYRDGFIQLAALAYQLGQDNQAKEFLDRALILDPYSPEARQLLSLITPR